MSGKDVEEKISCNKAYESRSFMNKTRRDKLFSADKRDSGKT